MSLNMFESDLVENGQRAGTPYSLPGIPDSAGYGSLSQTLGRGWWLILLSLLIGGAAAYLCLQYLTPYYESTARLLIGKPGAPPDWSVSQLPGSTSSNYVQTQVGLIKTREILDAAMSDPNVLALPALRLGDRLEKLVRTLKVDIAKGTDLVSISARSERPEEAAALVNAVVRAYVRWHEAHKQVGTADLVKELKAERDKRLSELQDERNKKMLFEQRHPEVVEHAREGAASKTPAQLQQSLVAARLNKIEQDSHYRVLLQFQADAAKLRQYVKNRGPIGSEMTPEEAERTTLAKARSETQLQIDEVSAGRAVRGLDIKVLKNKLVEIEKRIAESDQLFVQRNLDLAQADAKRAAVDEQAVAEMYEAELAEVQKLGVLNAEYASIDSEYTVLENICNGLTTQMSNLAVNAHLEGPNAYVLERAVPATQPAWPKPIVVFALGLAGGLMVGVGLALLRDRRDQSVRSAGEVTALLGLPVLGAVPLMSARRLTARGQRLRFDSASRESEAYRSIRTSLFLGTPREHAHTILVTSPGPLEGKTTLVSNLGIAMAHAGQKILILDADLRKPMQHRVFGMNRHNPGLTDVLLGTATLEEAIQTTEIPGLDVLASGQGTAHPSELLNSPGFMDVLEQLKSKYDRILVDSPPVGIVTDAQILASLCGLTLLVLKANRSSRLLTQRAGDALLTVSARVAGVVVNGVSRKDNQYSHYGALKYYESRYGSGNIPTTGHELPPGVGHRPGSTAPMPAKG